MNSNIKKTGKNILLSAMCLMSFGAAKSQDNFKKESFRVICVSLIIEHGKEKNDTITNLVFSENYKDEVLAKNALNSVGEISAKQIKDVSKDKSTKGLEFKNITAMIRSTDKGLKDYAFKESRHINAVLRESLSQDILNKFREFDIIERYGKEDIKIYEPEIEKLASALTYEQLNYLQWNGYARGRVGFLIGKEASKKHLENTNAILLRQIAKDK